jgi:radical SAM protein with 4Fe4S-binding SPASM domain
VRLSWERGFDPRFFSTTAGAEYAQRPPYFLTNQIDNLTTDEFIELKFEVTDQCNLACAFCHQDFGIAAGHQVLDRITFQRTLTRARDEGISALRLTGGEPTILKHINWYLEQAKDMGFHVTVNSNGTALTPQRLIDMRGLVDCFKISLPAADELAMTKITGDRRAWQRKWEAIGHLAGYGFNVEILSVMTRENIHRFEDFIKLLEPLDFLRWVLLRAEPQEGNERPVSRADISMLAGNILAVRRLERWENLALGLAVPFCALDDPFEAARLFEGGRGCGPVQSLTVKSTGEFVRCYSRRANVDIHYGIREASRALSEQDFAELPSICQNCGFWFACRGGCRCGLALEETPFGLFDYLADPTGLPDRLERSLEIGR